MAVTNESASASGVLLIYQQMFQVTLTQKDILKISISLLMSLSFTYLNAIMVYTIWNKATFKETPRYILFMHMLINDSFQHLSTSVLFISNVILLRMIMSLCSLFSFVSTTTFKNAPLNLAVMCLERFVAICFPLRHPEIANQRRTYIAITVIWLIGSLNYTIDMLYNLAVKPNFLTSVSLCTRDLLILQAWQGQLLLGFNAFLFVFVGLIILSIYICILLTARSVSSKKDSAIKAQQTVLLHLIQLGLCLTSFAYNTIERATASAGNIDLVNDLRFLNYLFILLLPRCLSPMIYGLRDDAIRTLFIYHFRCARGKHQVAVTVH